MPLTLERLLEAKRLLDSSKVETLHYHFYHPATGLMEWFRRPQSRKARIQRKWQKQAKNWRQSAV